MIKGRGAGFLPALELEIQLGARRKDPKFILSKLFPEYFKFIRMEKGFKVLAVDGRWINDNVSAIYGHGGHGYVHEFIPTAPVPEIWVSTHHPENCSCRNVRKDRLMSENYFNRTARHEISEFLKMAGGMPFKEAHQKALKEEKEEGCQDPYAEEISF